MMGRFTVLASGSSGNAALLEADGFGVLIDCGLHPRALASRLRDVGASWGRVNAVILTHIHGDHWKDLTLAGLSEAKIPLYAHADHHDHLNSTARAYGSLQRSKLIREYADGEPVALADRLTLRPLRVSHDAEPTFAFRIDFRDSRGPGWSIGYASDLGCGSSGLIDAFAGVDVLALEFNHDVRMECRSRRPRYLIDRVLSDSGHLSNEQAAELAAAIARRSGDSPPGHLVQLHLSRECNRPELARRAGQAGLTGLAPGIEITTASQLSAARSIPLTARVPGARRDSGHRIERSFQPFVQPALPGFE
jgi:phosphoribosyl 1,2-cyclic phosphodiesterase